MFAEKIFSARLRALRQAEGLTLEQLGAPLGATKATIGNLEHARKKPSLDMAIALADYFGVSLDYLVGRSDDPTRR